MVIIYPRVSGIVLAGGLSSRMGINKAFLSWGGEPLVVRAMRLLRTFFPEVIITTANPSPYLSLGFKAVSDLIPNQGPLGGIHTGLCFSASFYNFILAVDMPFLNPLLVRYLVERSRNFDVTVPWVGGYPQPLCGVYSKHCLYPIEKNLKGGFRKVTGFYPAVRVNLVREEELAPFLGEATFFNLNTEKDWRAAWVYL